MARATYEGLERLRPQRRPWVLTRSASIGAQRWAASWMGDNASTWADLRTSLPQLASMGLSGSPHVGVDIGGFFGACDGELFARWIELGAFYPFMRAHAYFGSPPQAPWAFGASTEAVARTAIERRYRFLPYLYTLAHRAHRRGEPLTKLILDVYPSDEPGGSWTLIEDAGDGCNHAHDAGAGAGAETDVDLGLDAAGPTLMIGQRQGGWRPHPRTLVLRLHLAQRPERLLLDGRPGANWWWDSAHQAAVVSLQDDGQAHQLSLE